MAHIAAALRRGGFQVEVGEIELVEVADVPPEIPKKGPVVMRRDLAAEVLGKRIPLGTGQIVLEDFEISQRGTDESGNRILALRPSSGEAAKTIEEISKPHQAKRPSPPPRKKHRSHRGRSRRRGGR